MSMPVISKDAALAVFDKAMKQSPEEYIGEGLLKMIKDNQTGLVSIIAGNAEGFADMAKEVYPEMEGLESVVSLMVSAASLMVYESIKAQIEAEEMKEMFAE